jgi:hypothetical protein
MGKGAVPAETIQGGLVAMDDLARVDPQRGPTSE